MAMEASVISTANYNDEDKALKILLDAFGPSFSLEEIAVAYCKANRNADLAGEILYDMKGSSSSSSSASDSSYCKSEVSPDSPYDNSFQYTKPSESKLTWVPVPKGTTVSNELGKGHLNNREPPSNGYSMVSESLKVYSNESRLSKLWVEKGKPYPVNGGIHKDMEDFLFKMLGDAFLLDMNQIRVVLDSCGYDMQKSMDKLIGGSAIALDARKKYDAGPATQQKLGKTNAPGGNGDEVLNTNEGMFQKKQKQRQRLQKEILESLFDTNGRSEKLPERTKRIVERSKKALGEVVVGPPTEFIEEEDIDVGWMYTPCDIIDNGNEEDGYHALRKAVTEYRGIMKEYYKAAADAFAKGDRIRAYELLEKGQFFNGKARQADEESSQKIFEINKCNGEKQDELVLDLHEHGAKDAKKLLKCHLSSLAGISSIKYLKVIIYTNDEDISKGSRRKTAVKKLLEQECIEWIEEGDAGTIHIRIDKINPQRLSFANPQVF